MKTLNDFNFENKKALIRVDFNVPLDGDFKVTDTTRIQAAKPTIVKILEDGGSAILMSHLGRPKGKQEEFSLKHIVETVQDILGVQVKMAPDCIGADVEALAAALEPGEILLLENLRYYKEETAGDKEFAEKLSKLGDIYINDAFGTAHRAHASTAIIAEFFEEKGAGFVIEAEIVNAKKVLETGVSPVTAIMGGSKISDKILIVEKLLGIADNIIIGGGMSYTFVKALGGDIGLSLCEDDKLDLALELLEKAKANNVKMILPLDTVIADDFSNDANIQTVKRGMIPEKWEGLDIGPATREQFSEIIENSKTVIWNGPMGVAEMENFAHGTIAIAHAVKNATAKGAFSLIGGGDSAAAINNLGFGNDVSYVSTGGGALLEYMEGKVLPGIAAIS